jgi:hypothetical protein
MAIQLWFEDWNDERLATEIHMVRFVEISDQEKDSFRLEAWCGKSDTVRKLELYPRSNHPTCPKCFPE